MEIDINKDFKDELIFNKSNINFLQKKYKEIGQKWLDIVDSSTLSKIDKKKKRIEIVALSRFICHYDIEILINNVLQESPDFIIERDKKLIGIELTDLIILNDEKQIEGILNKLFLEIEEELSIDLDKYRGIYKVKFLRDIKLKRKDRINIKNEVIFYIKNNRLSNKNCVIEYIRKTPCKIISIKRTEVMLLNSLKRESVLNTILSKEKKFVNYQLNVNVDEFWLLLVASGFENSSDYDAVDSSVIDIYFKSNFDKIFIFNTFDKKVVELRINSND